jgi:hypothetical protein
VEVSLPSGHTATLRDQFMRGDRRDAEHGIVIVVNADGSRRIEGGLASSVTGRILRRMIVAWSYPDRPVPSAAGTDELGQRILDGLPDDDAEALERAIDPWVQRVIAPNRGPEITHIPTGVKLRLVNPEDAAKLDGYEEEFTVTGADGPKSTPTGITSAQSPGLTGPEPATDPTP